MDNITLIKNKEGFLIAVREDGTIIKNTFNTIEPDTLDQRRLEVGDL